MFFTCGKRVLLLEPSVGFYVFVSCAPAMLTHFWAVNLPVLPLFWYFLCGRSGLSHGYLFGHIRVRKNMLCFRVDRKVAFQHMAWDRHRVFH